MDGPAGGYVPTVRGGGKMRVRMMCLGRHWNPLTYTYEDARDHDGEPVAPVPADWVALARGSPPTPGSRAPDICLINYYGAEGRMGLHQDKDERPDSMRPVFRWSRSRSATPRASCSAGCAGVIR